MYAIVEVDYDYDGYSSVDSVTLYHNINNGKEYSELYKGWYSEFKKITAEAEKTRKARKLRKTLANSQAIMKELGYVTWDEYLQSKEISYEKIEFDTN